FIRQLDPGTRWRFQINGKLPGVGARKKGKPQKRKKPEAQNKRAHQQSHGQDRKTRRSPHQLFVHIEHAVKPAIEGGVEASAPRKFGSAMPGLALPSVSVRNSLQKARTE